jgi:hypothetical protein
MHNMQLRPALLLSVRAWSRPACRPLNLAGPTVMTQPLAAHMVLSPSLLRNERHVMKSHLRTFRLALRLACPQNLSGSATGVVPQYDRLLSCECPRPVKPPARRAAVLVRVVNPRRGRASACEARTGKLAAVASPVCFVLLALHYSNVDLLC